MQLDANRCFIVPPYSRFILNFTKLLFSANCHPQFAAAAKSKSTCPSSKKGGSLGSFGPGQMVPEFDAVAFKKDIGVIHGPIRTDFGSHLIIITERE